MRQTELFTQAEQKLSPRNQYEAVIYFMAHLDIEMVSSFLDDDRTYQDFPKYLFISKLIKAFEQFEKADDRVLSLHKGGCAGCSKGCRGFTFLGKQGDYMDILFLMEGDEIKDIYECSNFVNDEEVLNKLRSVDIDPLSFPFGDDDTPF
ncbi:MAG: hypothetical protein NTY88_06095 [Bacteroidetes bacterium]|nr:hypothetical protein [Bacteroidota bacterium]